MKRSSYRLRFDKSAYQAELGIHVLAARRQGIEPLQARRKFRFLSRCQFHGIAEFGRMSRSQADMFAAGHAGIQRRPHSDSRMGIEKVAEAAVEFGDGADRLLAVNRAGAEILTDALQFFIRKTHFSGFRE